MKYLIIEDGVSKYTTDPSTPASKMIDQISKEDLLVLIESCISDEDFEMDVYDETVLQNKAHQIIYKNIYQKLNELKKQRVRFSDEKTVLYRAAITQYSADLSDGIAE